MKIINSVEYGKFLKIRRKELGYTQVDLSDIAGFSVSFISDIERGKPTAELGKVIELSKLLGVDLYLEVRR